MTKKLGDNLNMIGSVYGIKIYSSPLVKEGFAYSQKPEDVYVSEKDYEDLLAAKDSKALEKVVARIQYIKIPEFKLPKFEWRLKNDQD